MLRLRSLRTFSLLALACFLVPTTASATPVQVGIGAFPGSETIIDFNALADATVITNQFSGSGVVFSSPGGSVFSDNNGPGFFAFGSPAAQNFDNFCDGGSCFPWRADFTPNLKMVGFDQVSDGGTLVVDVFSGGSVTTLNIAVPVGPTTSFVGISDIGGNFDGIRVTAPGSGGMAFDNLRMVLTPEPGTASLLGLGLIALAARRRRA